MKNGMTVTTKRSETEILEAIVMLCFDALDPILTRPELIEKIRAIYDLAALDDPENEDDLDSEGDSPKR
jgi:hypothetical protein